MDSKKGGRGGKKKKKRKQFPPNPNQKTKTEKIDPFLGQAANECQKRNRKSERKPASTFLEGDPDPKRKKNHAMKSFLQ